MEFDSKNFSSVIRELIAQKGFFLSFFLNNIKTNINTYINKQTSINVIEHKRPNLIVAHTATLSFTAPSQLREVEGLLYALGAVAFERDETFLPATECVAFAAHCAAQERHVFTH